MFEYYFSDFGVKGWLSNDFAFTPQGELNIKFFTMEYSIIILITIWGFILSSKLNDIIKILSENESKGGDKDGKEESEPMA